MPTTTKPKPDDDAPTYEELSRHLTETTEALARERRRSDGLLSQLSVANRAHADLEEHAANLAARQTELAAIAEELTDEVARLSRLRLALDRKEREVVRAADVIHSLDKDLAQTKAKLAKTEIELAKTRAELLTETNLRIRGTEIVELTQRKVERPGSDVA